MDGRRKISLLLGGIFLVMLSLNSLYGLSVGDDYVYSFLWEGHSIYEPLSEDARRIDSFSDIAISAWAYYLTWGGRLVAQAMAMGFLWMPKWVYDIAASLATVLLVLLVQWIAREGRVTLTLSPLAVAMTAFSFWSFHAHFEGIFLWIDGSCNYLWPLLLLLLFLLPYIRHYFTDGAVIYKFYMTPLLFFLGLLAGNGNENTICWIGLFGFFYLLHCFRKGNLRGWMVAGFLGLTIGYGLLMLSPGNFLRLAERHEVDAFSHIHVKGLVLLWSSTILQSPLWFYLLKGFRKWKSLSQSPYGKKYLHLALWMTALAWCVNLIMLASPEFPNRSLFPAMTFCISAVFLLYRAGEASGVNVLSISTARFFTRLAALYFLCTFSVTLWWFIGAWEWRAALMENVAACGEEEILVLEEDLPRGEQHWYLLSGLHTYGSGISSDEKNWRNVAFARYYHIGGIRLRNGDGK